MYLMRAPITTSARFTAVSAAMAALLTAALFTAAPHAFAQTRERPPNLQPVPEPPPPPKAVVEVFRGDKHVREVFK